MIETETTNIRLPVGKVLIGALAIPWQRRARYLRALGIPALVMLLAGLVDVPGTNGLGFVNGLAMAVALVAGTVFAVTCHRLVLLGDAAVPAYGVSGWSSRETRFIFWSILTSFLVMLIAIPVLVLAVMVVLSFAPGMVTGGGGQSVSIVHLVALWLIAGLIFSYGFGRVFLVLPATAVGRKATLAWALRASRGNGWRLAVVVLIAPGVLIVLPAMLLVEQPSIITQLLVNLAGIVVAVIEIVAMSLSYHVLAGDQLPVELDLKR